MLHPRGERAPAHRLAHALDVARGTANAERRQRRRDLVGEERRERVPGDDAQVDLEARERGVDPRAPRGRDVARPAADRQRAERREARGARRLEPDRAEPEVLEVRERREVREVERRRRPVARRGDDEGAQRARTGGGREQRQLRDEARRVRDLELEPANEAGAP